MVDEEPVDEDPDDEPEPVDDWDMAAPEHTANTAANKYLFITTS